MTVNHEFHLQICPQASIRAEKQVSAAGKAFGVANQRLESRPEVRGNQVLLEHNLLTRQEPLYIKQELCSNATRVDFRCIVGNL